MRIKIDSILVRKYSKNNPSEKPSEIQMNNEVSWMIGFWIGDNWSNREGSVVRRGKRSSGKFGINNNDEENISRFLKGLRNQFGINNIKIDVQVPRNQKLRKEVLRDEVSKRFGIDPSHVNVYFGSPWRKKIGYTVYTNNTFLLRLVFNEIYKKIPELMETLSISDLMQGIADSEGTVDKANMLVSITNKDKFVLDIVERCLESLNIEFSKRQDRDRTRIDIRDIKGFEENIGFNTHRNESSCQR